MKQLKKEVISVLDAYLKGDREDRVSLSTWANKKIVEMLNLEVYYDLENLVLYPFLSLLSIEDSWEMCSDEQITEIYNVLIGIASNEYSCFIRLKNNQDIELLEKEFLSYLVNGKISDEVKEEFYNLKKVEVINLHDLLLVKLLSLLLTLPNEQGFEIDSSTIMVPLEEIDVSDIIEEAKRIFSYLKGDKAIHINILYNIGISNIMIF